MKNTIKLLGVFLVVFGVFALVGSVSASEAEMLQPAELVTYDEDVDVNGTLSANSAYIGEEGVGGVTFFNGSIVNVGADTPVTVADDLRVDGEIWRIEKGGANPLKVSDHIVPTLDRTNNFGSPTQRWFNGYFSDTVFASSTRTGAATTNTVSIHTYDPDDIIGPEIGRISNYGDSRLGITTDNKDIIMNAGWRGDNKKVRIEEHTRFNLTPQDGTVYTCNSSNYGDIIFSDRDLGGGTNRFYGCTGSGIHSGWQPL